MSKDQLKNMRALIAAEVRGSAAPKIAKSELSDYERRGWLKDGKSTEAGRSAVLTAGRANTGR